ncbi:MAG TPA: dienelactone hydrolase family protein, partial [Gemmatimonadaceae bacterium]|nr:dienelactone hydrolase family protein [Gemmatimonadaceae bacterium]
MPVFRRRALVAALAFPLGACASSRSADDSASARSSAGASAASAPAQGAALPAGAEEAQARLASSPRHGEWVMVGAGAGDSVRAWVVYPERKEKAPVVLVVHEIYGLTPWIRAVADQLAADGFIAIAPDLLSGKNIPEGPNGPVQDSAVAAIRALKPEDVQRRLDAVASYGMSLPAAERRYGIVGFCWGGGVSFAHAVHAPGLGASVVYYGTSPDAARLSSVRAPVLGLYGGNDARVNSTIPAADSAMKAMGKTYEPHIFEGAGHGFLRQQSGQEGANLAAAKQAWPLTVAWF